MPACPTCLAAATARHAGSAYWSCVSCGCAFQSPAPAKRYATAQERAACGAGMCEADRSVNRALAAWLFETCLQSRPSRTLDVGCAFPILARGLRDLGCDAAGLDVDPESAAHGAGLGVPVVVGDVETLGIPAVLAAGAGGRYRLVTLVNVFDRLLDPSAALRKLRSLVADDGRVFLRMPDLGVAGADRFLRVPHVEVAPCVYTFPAVLELLVRAGDLFTVERTSTLEGTGQRDFVLKPLARRPQLLAGLIVKNEERDLPRCLNSIEGVVDGVVVVDTGSTDRTLDVAVSTIAKPVHAQTYLGASRRDGAGDWKLWDFGKARNVFVDEIERRGADWVLWMDADDELLTPVNLRRAVYWDEYDVYGVQIESGGQRWVHHRLWRAGRGIRFEGRCHEYPTIGGHPALVLVDSVIRHDATPGAGEGANARNLRILTEEFAEAPSPRVAFYLGSTHKDAGRWREAVEAYATRIAMGEGYRDEWLFAWLYKARCERAAGDVAAAERTLLEAVAHERTWSEFWMELAYLAYDQGRWNHAMGYALQALDRPVPPTQLWREPDKYADQPARIVSLCQEQLGDLEAALEWTRRARRSMAAPTPFWEERVRQLESAVRRAR